MTGAELRQRIIDLGIPIRQVSKAAGYSESYSYNVLSGHYRMGDKFEKLMLLALRSLRNK